MLLFDLSRVNAYLRSSLRHEKASLFKSQSEKKMFTDTIIKNNQRL